MSEPVHHTHFALSYRADLGFCRPASIVQCLRRIAAARAHAAGPSRCAPVQAPSPPRRASAASAARREPVETRERGAGLKATRSEEAEAVRRR